MSRPKLPQEVVRSVRVQVYVTQAEADKLGKPLAAKIYDIINAKLKGEK